MNLTTNLNKQQIMDNKFSQAQAEIIVLLPHYNDNERLKNAINSIEEPFAVDVLIIDDASELKPNEQELKNIYENKGNLEVKYVSQNMKMNRVLNLGLEIILQTNYKYIARMDSDDTNKPNRLAKQIAFLKDNQNVSLVGSWGDYYDEFGKFLFTMKLAVSDKEIRKKMYLNSMFLHSAVLFKREIIENIGGYSDKTITGSDYRFLFKVIKNYQVANYPEPLVNINVRRQSMSSKLRFKQVLERLRVVRENFYFGFYPIWGLFRNLTLLFLPRSFGLRVRKWFKIGKMPI